MTYYQKGFAERYPWSDMDREVKIVRPIIENDPAECERLAVSMGL